MNVNEYREIVLNKLKNRIVGKGQDANYVVLLPDSTSVCKIPPDEEDQLLADINNMVKNGEKPIQLSQYTKDIFPFKVDFDLKLPTTSRQNGERLIDDKQIYAIVNIYGIIFAKFFGQNVYDKTAIVCKRANVEIIGDKIKDGLHIYFPGVVVDKRIRDEIHAVAHDEIFSGPLVEFANISGVLDSKVTAWRVYGCMVGNKLPYLMSYAINYETMEKVTNLPDNMCAYLSSHGKTDLTRIIDMNLLRKFSEPIIKKVDPMLQNDAAKLSKGEYAMIDDLLANIDHDNWYDETKWHKMACILASHRGPRNPQLFELFDKYSKIGGKEKYSKEAVIKKWERNDIIGRASIASLWGIIREQDRAEIAKAKRDGKQDVTKDVKYRVLVAKWALVNLEGGTVRKFSDNDYAEMWLLYNKGMYVSTTEGNKRVLYKFCNHIWQKLDSCAEINESVCDTLNSVFNGAIMNLTTQSIINALDAGGDVSRIKAYSACACHVGNYTTKLHIVQTIFDKINVDGFAKKLNSKNIIACKNGVFDADAGIFRSGMPEDYCSLQLEWDYVPFSEIAASKDAAIIGKVKTMISDLYPDPQVRKYVLQLFASCFQITGLDKHLYIFIGPKHNGKSSIFDFMGCVFGQGVYYQNVNPEIFLHVVSTFGKPTPEFIAWKNKRLLVGSETNNGNYLSQAFVKELTGSTTFLARQMYAQEIETIKRTFKIFLQTNFFPRFEPDAATETRLVAIPHDVTFYDPRDPEYDKNNPTHKVRDDTLSFKLNTWAPVFMSWLWEIFLVDIRGKNGIEIPERVRDTTQLYINKNDPIVEFIITKMTKCNEEFTLDIGEIYIRYAEWLSKFKRGTRQCDFSTFTFQFVKKCKAKVDNNIIYGLTFKG